jgi:hypothetical protein
MAQPAIGQDVTDLMPQVGDDVSELMAPVSAPAPKAPPENDGFHPVVDLARGVGAGILKTAYGGGDIIRRGAGAAATL